MVKKKQDASELPACYDIDALETTRGVDEVISRLERKSRRGELRAELNILAKHPTRLLAVLTSHPERLQSILEPILIAQWPKDLASYLSTTQPHASILLALHSFLAPIRLLDLKNYLTRSIPYAHRGLEALASFKFNDTSETFIKKRVSQKAKKIHTRGQSVNATGTIVQSGHWPYELELALEMEAPESALEVENFAMNLLYTQERALEIILESFRDPNFVAKIHPHIFQTVKYIAPPVIEPPREVVVSVDAGASHKSGGPLPSANIPAGVSSPAPVPIVAPVPAPIATPDTVSDAYPTVAPERAKQFLDTPEGFGDWHIFVSSKAVAHLREFLRRDKKAYAIILKKIKQLSCGHFSADNQKRLKGGDDTVAIFEAKMTGDLRLVYQIDLHSDLEAKEDRQIIRLHGVFTHAQFDDRLWAQMTHAISNRSAEYHKRCNYRVTPKTNGIDTTLPMSWPHENYEAPAHKSPEALKTVTEVELLELHKHLALEKFIHLSNAVIKSIMEDIDTSHVFSTSPTESLIIQHPSSCFVIGRSGTGKTTTMLFKLLKFEAAYSDPGAPRHRQMFLTQSHVLAQRVEEFYGSLVESTQNVLYQNRQRKNGEIDLLDLDEEAESRPDLPQRFSQLEDKHFPLFVTFDQLRKMLEADLGLDFSRNRSVAKRRAIAGEIDVTGFNADLALNALDDVEIDEVVVEMSAEDLRQCLVTFDIFLYEYWPHFDQRLTKGLDPALVFSEIMGIIQGHEETVHSAKGYLSRDAYFGLGDRAYSSFATQRERIWNIFTAYRQAKLENNSYDGPDRTHAILNMLNKKQKNLGTIDFLYVDEVQDLNLIDTKLLRHFCTNPHGLFLAGDVAQTISVGSSFRFEDLKALMYREEMANSLVKLGARAPIHPEMFQLNVNWRSHGGIVDCAASLIRLMATLFPYSIDQLKRESAVVAGPKPCVFRGFDEDQIHFEQFLFGAGNMRIDFGARQVIIVRNESVRESLRDQLGDAGLILTLLESKGLEFDDVLLYGFFENSAASASQWRVVLSDPKNPDNAAKGVPTVDPIKHAVVNSELKHLYVGITRARHHCWIWDNSPQAAAMVEHWTKQNLVRVLGPSDEIPRLAADSTPEDWRETGQYLFARAFYAQAAMCFSKAGREHDRMDAEAHELRKRARRFPKSGDARLQAFRTAAEAFSECAEATTGSAAERRQEKAADCFTEARLPIKAAHAYEKAALFTKAAKIYRREGLFEDAIRLARPRDGPTQVDLRTAEEIIDVTRLQYIRTGLLSQAAELFDSPDEQLEYMDDRGFDTAHKAVLEQLGKHEDAAQLYHRDGQTLEAIECLLRSPELSQKHYRNAAAWALDGIWAQAYGSDLKPSALTILKALNDIPLEQLAPEIKAEITMFNAIASKDPGQIIRALRTLYLFDGGIAYPTLCLDTLIRSNSSLSNNPIDELVEMLERIQPYCATLAALVRHTDILADLAVCKLLGFSPSLDPATGEPVPNEYGLAPGSHLAGLVMASQQQQRPIRIVSETAGGGLIVSGQDLSSLIHRYLDERLKTFLVGVHSEMINAKVLRPCIDNLVSRSCNRIACDRDHSTPVNLHTIRQRVRIHMQITVLLDHMSILRWPISQYDDRQNARRVWTERFFSTLFPVLWRMGNSAIPSFAIPEAHRAMSVLRSWTAEGVYALDPDLRSGTHFTTGAIMLVMFCSNLHGGAPDLLKGASGLFKTTDWLIRDGSPFSVTVSLVKSYQLQGALDVAQGMLFMRHVVAKGLAVDINVLVHYIEHLARAMIVSRFGGTLHGLTLPKSWIQVIIRWVSPPTRAEAPLTLLMPPLIELMRRIYQWDGSGNQLWLNGRKLGRAWVIKNAMLARICQLLALVGYNNRGNILERDMILNALGTFRSLGSHNYTYSEYVNASSWNDIARALHRSMSLEKDIDYLVRLQHVNRPAVSRSANVRTVEFQDHTQIKNALSYDPAPAHEVPPVTSAPSVSAQLPIASDAPSEPVSQPLETVPDVAEDSEPLIDDDELAGMGEDEADGGGDATEEQTSFEDDITNSSSLSDTVEQPRTEAEIAAVLRLQEWFRRHLTRMADGAKSSKSKLHSLYAECVADVPNIKPPTVSQQLLTADAGAAAPRLQKDMHYIRLMQGPLPCVLYVLEELLVLVRKAKDDNKRRLKSTAHLELEKVSGALTHTTNLYKATLAARKKLSPGFALFRSGDTQAVKEAVSDVLKLFEEARKLAKGVDALEEDMQLGWKGIVKPSAPRKVVPKPEKPALNMEKEYDY